MADRDTGMAFRSLNLSLLSRLLAEQGPPLRIPTPIPAMPFMWYRLMTCESMTWTCPVGAIGLMMRGLIVHNSMDGPRGL